MSAMRKRKYTSKPKPKTIPIIDPIALDDTDDYQESVRAPDPIVRERLVDNPFFESSDMNKDKDLQLAIEENMRIKEEKEYEQALLEILKQEEIERRRNQWADFLSHLYKIRKYVTEAVYLLQALEPIIQLYCDMDIDNMEIDFYTYYRIFHMLDTIRVKKTDIENLKLILICAEESNSSDTDSSDFDTSL
jgi:hypothetical protein